MTASAQQAVSDSRQRLVLHAQHRDGVLAEMQQMLKAMSDVIDALSQNDPKAAAEAARTAGMAVAVGTAPQLEVSWPARRFSVNTKLTESQRSRGRHSSSVLTTSSSTATVKTQLSCTLTGPAS